MKVCNLDCGQNLLLLRYSSSLKESIIEEHRSLIDKQGYVWYGKLSGITSDRIISAVLSAEYPGIILYQKGKAYLCELSDFTINKPDEGYPKYYDEEYIFPTCYFKLKSMDEISLDVFDDLYVRSSKRSLTEVFSKQCMSSSLFVAYKEIKEIEVSDAIKRETKKTKLGKNECMYRTEGICNLQSFINYGYTCEKPQSCIKQKR